MQKIWKGVFVAKFAGQATASAGASWSRAELVPILAAQS